MADDVNQQIDDALNNIVKLTDQSGNLKRELKNEIHETISSLRNLIFTLKGNLNERINENSELQNEVNGFKKDLKAHRHTQTVGQVAPSIGSIKELYAEALRGKNVR
jgi:regulator of replication initiation timing